MAVSREELPGSPPLLSLSLMSCIKDQKETAPSETRRRGFHPFRGLRKIFRRRQRTTEVPKCESPGPRSRSTSQLLDQGDDVVHSGLSVSHDSVFCLSQQSLETSSLSMPIPAPSSTTNLPKLGNFNDVPPNKQGVENVSDDEDMGLPASPLTHSPVAGYTNITHKFKEGLTKSSHSTCSDGSLLSMASSECDYDSRTSSKLSLQDKKSFGVENNNDDFLPGAGSLNVLSHSAAKHKMAIRPKRKHTPARHRRHMTSLPSTPEVLEDVPLPVSPEQNKSNTMPRTPMPDPSGKSCSLPIGVTPQDVWPSTNSKEGGFFSRLLARRSGKKRKSGNDHRNDPLAASNPSISKTLSFRDDKISSKAEVVGRSGKVSTQKDSSAKHGCLSQEKYSVVTISQFSSVIKNNNQEVVLNKREEAGKNNNSSPSKVKPLKVEDITAKVSSLKHSEGVLPCRDPDSAVKARVKNDSDKKGHDKFERFTFNSPNDFEEKDADQNIETLVLSINEEDDVSKTNISSSKSVSANQDQHNLERFTEKPKVLELTSTGKQLENLREDTRVSLVIKDEDEIFADNIDNTEPIVTPPDTIIADVLSVGKVSESVSFPKDTVSLKNNSSVNEKVQAYKEPEQPFALSKLRPTKDVLGADKKEEEPELLKVFARRSMKIKDEDIALKVTKLNDKENVESQKHDKKKLEYQRSISIEDSVLITHNVGRQRSKTLPELRPLKFLGTCPDTKDVKTTETVDTQGEEFKFIKIQQRREEWERRAQQQSSNKY